MIKWKKRKDIVLYYNLKQNYNNKMTIVQVSAPLFWGYKKYIPNNKIILMSENEIADDVKEDMKLFFKKHNLLDLFDKIKELKLHIHEEYHKNIGDEGDIIYLCNHDDFN